MCPEMIVVPAGGFLMGSPEWESGSDSVERPQHWVTIPAPFAIGKYEVTVDEYGRFVEDVGWRPEGGCYNWATVDEKKKKWETFPERNWRSPGFKQGDKSPVVCVSWEDAQAYVEWLSRESGERYRLLTEAEWEYAARAGTYGPFHFGETITSDQANYDGNFDYNGSDKGVYRERTTRGGMFPPNDFGLHDMHGNAWEWVEDCYNADYEGAPADGSAWRSGDCIERVIRSGSWLVKPVRVRSANRGRKVLDFRGFNYGFRVAKTLSGVPRTKQEKNEQAPITIQHCPECPEMIRVSGGKFTMGSPAEEGNRYPNEGPLHEVEFAVPFAVSRYEVTRREFAYFVEETGHPTGDECYTDEKGEWGKRSEHSWLSPGFLQVESHPVVCVSWEDAKTYVRWLSSKSKKPYRLLSEAEWEYAARARTTEPFHSGATISTQQANYNGSYTYGAGQKGDYWQRTLPGVSFPANAFGLHNVHGNAWEWVEDCWHSSYKNAPSDGSAWTWNGDCRRRVLRGGSWRSEPGSLRSAFRTSEWLGTRASTHGFRVALDLTP